MACRDCENREISKRQDPEGWRDMEMGPVECEKHRGAPMASEDVLERVEAMRQSDQLRWTTYRRDLVEMIEALAAEVRELRKDKARLDWLDSCEVTLVLHGPHRTSLAARDVIDAAMGGEGDE